MGEQKEDTRTRRRQNSGFFTRRTPEKHSATVSSLSDDKQIGFYKRRPVFAFVFSEFNGKQIGLAGKRSFY